MQYLDQCVQGSYNLAKQLNFYLDANKKIGFAIWHFLRHARKNYMNGTNPSSHDYSGAGDALKFDFQSTKTAKDITPKNSFRPEKRKTPFS